VGAVWVALFDDHIHVHDRARRSGQGDRRTLRGCGRLDEPPAGIAWQRREPARRHRGTALDDLAIRAAVYEAGYDARSAFEQHRQGAMLA